MEIKKVHNTIASIGNACTGCSACIQVCGKDAIKLEENQEGFTYPVVNTESCVDCGLCLIKCPVHGERPLLNKEVLAYAAYNRDEREREGSSSGGLFILLAKRVIAMGGYVYGAAYKEDLSVFHCKVDTESGLEKLMKSKYIQSDIGNAYASCKEDLVNGKSVLFTGTPCQIAGLKSYLGKEYEGLLTQDFVCHGVPSSKVWRNWVKQQQKLFPEISSVDFRSKKGGWRFFHISYGIGKNKFTYVSSRMDPYFVGFNDSLYLREACYDCKFKKDRHSSDVTVGDFWSVKKMAPVMDDDRGVSIIFLNTKRAVEWFDKLKPNLVYMPLNYELVCENHNMIVNSAEHHDRRVKFFERYDGNNLPELVAKLRVRPSFKKRMKIRILRLLHL